MESESVSARNAAEATPKGCAVASALTGKPTAANDLPGADGTLPGHSLSTVHPHHLFHWQGLDSRTRFGPDIDIRGGNKTGALNGRATQDWPHSVYLRCLSLGNE